MKQVESIIHDYIDKNSQLPSENLKDRILSDAVRNHQTANNTRHFSGKRILISITAAVLAFCLMGTAFAYGEQIYKYIVFSILGYSQPNNDPFAAIPENQIGKYSDFLEKEINPGELRRAMHSDGVGTSIKDVYIYNYIVLLERTKAAGILMPSFIPDGYVFDYGVIGAYIREGSELPLISSKEDDDGLLEVFALPENYENDIQYLDVFFKDPSGNYLRISVTRVDEIEDIEVVYGEDKQATSQKLSVTGFENGIIVKSKRENKDRVHGVLARTIPEITAISPSDHTKSISFGAESYTVLTENLSVESVISVLESFAE